MTADRSVDPAPTRTMRIIDARAAQPDAHPDGHDRWRCGRPERRVPGRRGDQRGDRGQAGVANHPVGRFGELDTLEQQQRRRAGTRSCPRRPRGSRPRSSPAPVDRTAPVAAPATTATSSPVPAGSDVVDPATSAAATTTIRDPALRNPAPTSPSRHNGMTIWRSSQSSRAPIERADGHGADHPAPSVRPAARK